MDKLLTREERRELLSLLGLPSNSWGDMAAIQKAYRGACRRYHPDKGGCEQTMKRLTELFTKAYDSLSELRTGRGATWDGQQVCCLYDYTTIFDFLGEEKAREKLMSNFSCYTGKNTMCRCFFCLLRMQHKNCKIFGNKKCLVWGECFCFYCYQQWFDSTEDFTGVKEWGEQIFSLHLDILMLWYHLQQMQFDW